VSLIHDAMKTAQRERAGRSQSDKSSAPLVEGFFPYVANSSTRSGSRRALIIAFSAAAVVLLAITGWLMWPKDSATRSTHPPIILPPPLTVSKTPPATDTAIARVVDSQVTAEPAQAVTSPPVGATDASVSRPNFHRSERDNVRQATLDTSAATRPDEQRDSIVEPKRIIPTRVDYEAEATVLFNAGDLSGAREKFALATRLAPNARAWTNYGVTLQRLGDLTGAAAAYQSAIGVDANYLEAWLYQGRLAAEQGDPARAVPLFQRARAINPRNADVNVELARLEADSKNWAEARRFAEEALRGDPTNIRAYWYLAIASDPLKDVDASIRGYSGYLQYVGDTPDQAQFIGWARTRLAELRGKP
jgi:Flp pilus assembly protein TadD